MVASRGSGSARDKTGCWIHLWSAEQVVLVKLRLMPGGLGSIEDDRANPVSGGRKHESGVVFRVCM